jgi:ABC-type sugar transport system ATPase subunit
MGAVELDGLDLRYPDGTHAVRDLSLAVDDGEFMVLLGPSGCGKSSLLRLVAGLEAPGAGEIRIGGERVNDRPPQRRNVAMVFQNYALYPHMSVRGNLAFPLRMHRLRRAEIERRVGEAARALGLGALLDRRPAELSGGQRQRVAMGRAMVREPSVFLMDEPLSNLDARLRMQVRGEIAELQRRLGTTTLYVTHDQVEAMSLGHRVAVLRAGTLQQVGPPMLLYERPVNLFVAGFLGAPPMNLFRAEWVEEGAGPRLRLGTVRLAPPRASALPAFVGLRPEAFYRTEQRPELPRIEVRAAAVERLGPEQVVLFDAPVPLVDPEYPEVAGPGVRRMAVRLPADRPVAPGERVTLALDPARLHWFDAAGHALDPGVR